MALLGNLLFPLIAFAGLFFLFRGAGGQVLSATMLAHCTIAACHGSGHCLMDHNSALVIRPSAVPVIFAS